LPTPDIKERLLISEIQKKLNTAEENQADLPMYLPRQAGESVSKG
jgi:hypothetical protein